MDTASTDASLNKRLLALLRDTCEICEAVGTRAYIWGGMAIDALRGDLTREHGDLDGMVLDLETHADALARAFERRGCQVRYMEAFSMLRVDRDGVHAGFNPLRVRAGTAQWKHIGEHGSVYFPESWLDAQPRALNGVPLYLAGARFEYAIKSRVRLLSPEWKPRARDIEAVEWLRGELRAQGIDDEQVYRRIWSYNPFWYERGYEAYFRPVLLWPDDEWEKGGNA